MIFILTMIAIIGIFDFWNYTEDLRNYKSKKIKTKKPKRR